MPWQNLKWRDLAPSEKALLLAFAAALPLISASLRVLGYKRTRWMLERAVRPQRPSQPATPDAIARHDRLAWIARKAAGWTPANTSCLRQSLLVHALVLRDGLQPELKFGVGQIDGVLDMHAWVELDGTPLGQPGLRHKPFQ